MWSRRAPGHFIKPRQTALGLGMSWQSQTACALLVEVLQEQLQDFVRARARPLCTRPYTGWFT